MMTFLDNYHVLYYTFVVCLSALMTLIAIPSILHVARARHLYDDLGHFRKQHDHGIPRLGGVAIFVSFMITILVFSIIDQAFTASYLLISSIILFATGLKDDLSGVNPSTKFLMQFIVSLILVIPGNIRLTSMYGMLGIFDLPYFISACLSILVIMLIINAFNLIDGIDGLAATLGVIANCLFAALFIYIRQYQLAMVALAIVGAIIGFLKFNLTPAKIFMGDAGSLLIGLISVVLAVKFIELNKVADNNETDVYSAPALAVAVLIVPVFDTIRVFVLRIANGGSPFLADRNHIHHLMLKLGLTHLQTTLILAALNIAVVMMALLFNGLGNCILVVLMFSFVLIFNWTITFLIRSRERGGLALRNFFL